MWNLESLNKYLNEKKLKKEEENLKNFHNNCYAVWNKCVYVESLQVKKEKRILNLVIDSAKSQKSTKVECCFCRVSEREKEK